MSGGNRWNRDRQRGTTCLVVVAVVLSAIGCSRPSRDAGRIVVSGSVTYDGKPLERGSVLFGAVDGRDAASAPIRTGGAFRVSLLPGEYGAAVRCFAEGQAPDPYGAEAPRSLIPEKYLDATTSGLKVTAAPGMPPIRLDLAR